jgi:hypothetical protein
MAEREEMRKAAFEDRENYRRGIDLDSTDMSNPDYHERFSRDHLDRYRMRSEAERARRRGRSSRSRSRSYDNDFDDSDYDDGFSDERAIYYMSQIRKKASLVANHLAKTAHHFTEDEVHEINQQIVDYVEMEKKVAAYVQKTADDFNKARDIENREKRLAYLEKVKAARKDRIPEEKAAREAARDHFLSIRKRMEPYLYPQKEL